MKILLKLQIGVLVLAMLVLNTVSCTKENPPAPASNTSAGLALDELVRKTGNKPKPPCHCPKPSADYGLVTTFAGSGTYGNVNGAIAIAEFGYMTALTSDAAGNLYLVVSYNIPPGGVTIKKICPGVVSDLAGNGGKYGTVDGTGNMATFFSINYMAFGPDGNLYATDASTIRKITPNGVVTTVIRAADTGNLTLTTFSSSDGIALDKQGNIFVSVGGNVNRIQKITPDGTVSTIAGSPLNGVASRGFINGTGTGASFNQPAGMVIDKAGNLYVSDLANFVIRKITPAGLVTTYAGSGTKGSADGPAASASFDRPGYLTIDSAGNIYASDQDQQAIRKITPAGIVSTLAGPQTSEIGYVNGVGSAARFNYPFGITADKSGNLFVADANNFVIRKIVIK